MNLQVMMLQLSGFCFNQFWPSGCGVLVGPPGFGFQLLVFRVSVGFGSRFRVSIFSHQGRRHLCLFRQGRGKVYRAPSCFSEAKLLELSVLGATPPDTGQSPEPPPKFAKEFRIQGPSEY